MREQLKSYIDLLFAGTLDAEDVKEEILQNTIDRYDDLICQGKTPQSAYQLAISGIGDVSELLRCDQGSSQETPLRAEQTVSPTPKPLWKKLLHATAICLYIMSPIPLFVLQDETGLCGLLVFVALATALIALSSDKSKSAIKTADDDTVSPHKALRNAVNSVIWAIGLFVYFALSFMTNAWYITWIMFPLIGAIQGLITACLDLKGAGKHEN